MSDTANLEPREEAPLKFHSLRRPRPGFLLALGFALAMICGIAVDRLLWRVYVPANAARDFQLMAQAWNIINSFYVERATLRPTNLTYGAISGMVDALGDTGHSAFLSPEMARQMRQSAEGSYVGIGVEIQRRGKSVVVISPLDDSPAQRARLRSGDVILKIDDFEVANLPLRQIVKRLAGPVGSPIRLTLLDPVTGRSREVSVERAETRVRPVSWRRLPGTKAAHLRISGFSEGVANEVKEALKEIEKGGLDGIVLDVRNNPGGILDEAVATASLFLRQGNVLQVRDAYGEVKAVPVKEGKATDLPVVALINRGSASSAEILAGALQDGRRALLVGERTFGTGTVLNEFNLMDGSVLMLAVQEWLTPSGKSIRFRGITPDIEVSLRPDTILLRPQSEGDLSPAQFSATEDRQLLRAWETLTAGTASGSR